MQSVSISNVISGVASNDLLTSISAQGLSKEPPAFSGLIKEAIGSEQNLEDQATAAAQGLMTGTGVDVHQAMIAAQKATMAFDMGLAVRNKAVAAYQQIMQMQF